jgi:predicted membrane channel-forming protein YqfA (hemolysin III family)
VSHGLSSLLFLIIALRRILRYLKKSIKLFVSHHLFPEIKISFLAIDKGIHYNPPHNQSALLLAQLLSSSAVFGISFFAHMFSSHSEEVNEILFRLDRAMIAVPTGITVLLTALFVFCEKGFMRFGLSFAIIMAMFICCYNVYAPKKPSPNHLVASFFSLGLLCLIPMTFHAVEIISKQRYV